MGGNPPDAIAGLANASNAEFHAFAVPLSIMTKLTYSLATAGTYYDERCQDDTRLATGNVPANSQDHCLTVTSQGDVNAFTPGVAVGAGGKCTVADGTTSALFSAGLTSGLSHGLSLILPFIGTSGVRFAMLVGFLATLETAGGG